MPRSKKTTKKAEAAKQALVKAMVRYEKARQGEMVVLEPPARTPHQMALPQAAHSMAQQALPAAGLAMAGPEGAAAAAALETLKPALESAYRELKRPLATCHLNDDLEIEVDSFEITPAGILTFGGVSVALLLLYLYLKGRVAWDPFGIGNFGYSKGGGLTGGAGPAAFGPIINPMVILNWLKSAKVI